MLKGFRVRHDEDKETAEHEGVLANCAERMDASYQLPYRVIFGGFANFLLFTNAQELVIDQNPPKITLQGIKLAYHSGQKS